MGSQKGGACDRYYGTNPKVHVQFLTLVFALPESGGATVWRPGTKHHALMLPTRLMPPCKDCVSLGMKMAAGLSGFRNGAWAA
eukprot:scaffold4181_cov22-Tisochrysis_lutea.AAC.3